MTCSVKDQAQQVIQLNKDHQAALRSYTDRLEAELQSVDKLLTLAEAADYDDEPDLDVKGFITVQGSSKAVGPVLSGELIADESPFYEDAERRMRYLSFTTIHPMKTKELDTLQEAVKTENYRIHAFNAQRRGEQPFPGLDAAAEKDLETNTEGIEWARVAEKVTTHAHTKRSAKECEIRWLGDRHPKIEHGPWSETDLETLEDVVPDVEPGEVNWVEISKHFDGRRTPMDCMRKHVHRRLHTWNDAMDERLVEAVSIYGQNNMALVARHVSEDATVAQCTNRWNRTVDPAISREAWSADEDVYIRHGVEAYGNSWVEVAAFLPGRSNEQCRDRWTELNPKTSKAKATKTTGVAWTKQMDDDLLAAVEDVGTNKWKEVTQQVAGQKTEKECRARYNMLKRSGGEGNDEPEAGPSRARAKPKAKPRTKRSAAVMEDEEEEGTPAPAKPKPKPRPLKKGKEVAEQVEAESTSKRPRVEEDEEDEDEAPETATAKKLRAKPKGKGRAKARKKAISDDDDDPEEEDDFELPEDEEAPKKKGPKPRPLGKKGGVAIEVGAADGGQAETSTAVKVVPEPTRRQPPRAARKPINVDAL